MKQDRQDFSLCNWVYCHQTISKNAGVDPGRGSGFTYVCKQKSMWVADNSRVESFCGDWTGNKYVWTSLKNFEHVWIGLNIYIYILRYDYVWTCVHIFQICFTKFEDSFSTDAFPFLFAPVLPGVKHTLAQHSWLVPGIRRVIFPQHGILHFPKPWEHHKKTMEKPQENGGLMGFDGIYLVVIKHGWLENCGAEWRFRLLGKSCHISMVHGFHFKPCLSTGGYALVI